VTSSTTPKLATYIACAGTVILLGLVTGEVELVVLAAPFLVALIMGLATVAPMPIEVRVDVDGERYLEGDEIQAEVSLLSQSSTEVEVGLAIPDTMKLQDTGQPVAMHLEPEIEGSWTFRMMAHRWGARRVGIIAVRASSPARLIVFEDLFDCSRLVKVYPTFERITRALPPIATRMFSGDYVSRGAADGIEFATVRPFVPGDSIRRVNWRVTSRTQGVHVNLAHPERNADVVLFLDTFTDAEMESESTLDKTVRGAAALAQHHLKHNDRVGLIGFGGSLRWLTASMGRTHAYRIADFLLDISATFSYAWKNIDLLPVGTLPPGASVIAFSPLVDRRVLDALVDISDRGYPLTVVNLLDENQVPPSAGPEGALAHRAWRLQREMVRARLSAAGIPVVDWLGDQGLHAALAAAPTRARRVVPLR
jgi:uncharacterized protein (DUF58 family)